MEMLAILMMLAASATAIEERLHPAVDNELLSHIRKNSPFIVSVTSGSPVSYCEITGAADKPLMLNKYFMENMASLVRERIPSRTVRPHGTGAFGYFELTHDMSHICKASLFSKVGKRTPVAVRFSAGNTLKGTSDVNRDIRGFAVKFYTDEGIFDMPGMSTPVFAIKDPRNYRRLIYGIRKDPSLYFYNPNSLWSLINEHPESMNMFMRMFADSGIPASYRNMCGHNVHSLQVENEQGVQSFIRMHLIPDAGIKNLRSAEAHKLGADDVDYMKRDLWDSLKKGESFTWTLKIQIVTEDDVRKWGSDLFDVTRVLPEKDFPLHPVGNLVLNRPPLNYFAEIESLCFSPGNLVRGIKGAPDSVFEARQFAYPDAQRYRLGADFNKIPVNCPFQNPDYIDSSDGSVDYDTENIGLLRIPEELPNNMNQVTEYYEGLPWDEKTRLIENIAQSLSKADKLNQEAALELFTAISLDLAKHVRPSCNLTLSK